MDEIEDTLPVSGLTLGTLQSSVEAAQKFQSKAATARKAVYEAICAARAEGMTDDELQAQLHMSGNTERPRRWELWKAERITQKRDAAGPVYRQNTRDRRCAVWIKLEKS